MIEPSLALRTAIRSRLLETPAVMTLLGDPMLGSRADRIRAEDVRPIDFPCIRMTNGVTTLHGHDYTSQRSAWVYLDLHIWTQNQADFATKGIVFAVITALDRWNVVIPGGYCDHFKTVSVVYPRDPSPEVGHGVLSVEALVRWVV